MGGGGVEGEGAQRGKKAGCSLCTASSLLQAAARVSRAELAGSGEVALAFSTVCQLRTRIDFAFTGPPSTTSGSSIKDECGEPLGGMIPQIVLPRSTTATASVVPVDLEALQRHSSDAAKMLHDILGDAFVTRHHSRPHVRDEPTVPAPFVCK